MTQDGNLVVYGANGVCRIEGTQTAVHDGREIEYLVLVPVWDENSKVLVPLGNKDLISSFSELIDRDGIIDLIKAIPYTRFPVIKNSHARQRRYDEIFSRGDRLGMLSIIDAVYSRSGISGTGRKPCAMDEEAVRHAEKILYSEFALVLGISPEQVPEFIRNTIGGMFAD